MTTSIRIINEGPSPVSVMCCNDNTEGVKETVRCVLQSGQVSPPVACYVYQGQTFKVVEGDLLAQKEQANASG